MAIFLCRWPNGSFSIVGAANRAEAVMELDEIGDTDGAEISRMPACMLDFEIAPPDSNQEIGFDSLIQFAGFGDQTRSFILKKAYPKLNEALGAAMQAAEADPAAARKLWVEAVEIEMHRIHHQAIKADTEIGCRIQQQTGMSGVVASRIVRNAGKRLLESLETDSKPKQ